MASSSENTSSIKMRGRELVRSVCSFSSSSLNASMMVRISPREATLLAGREWR